MPTKPSAPRPRLDLETLESRLLLDSAAARAFQPPHDDDHGHSNVSQHRDLADFSEGRAPGQRGLALGHAQQHDRHSDRRNAPSRSLAVRQGEDDDRDERTGRIVLVFQSDSPSDSVGSKGKQGPQRPALRSLVAPAATEDAQGSEGPAEGRSLAVTAEPPSGQDGASLPADQVFVGAEVKASLADERSPSRESPRAVPLAFSDLPADWARIAPLQLAGAPIQGTRQEPAPALQIPLAAVPAPRSQGNTPSSGSSSGRSSEEPIAPAEQPKPEAVADPAEPRMAGLLSAGSSLALSTLERVLDALTERTVSPGRPSLPYWLGLCGWGMGTALAWLGLRRRRTQPEVALTQENP